jgi:hypothetical protein
MIGQEVEAMISQKYADLGFEITKFGVNSRVLRFGRTPVFVFNSNTDIDADFLSHICDTYLKIREKRQSPVGIRVA